MAIWRDQFELFKDNMEEFSHILPIDAYFINDLNIIYDRLQYYISEEEYRIQNVPNEDDTFYSNDSSNNDRDNLDNSDFDGDNLDNSDFDEDNLDNLDNDNLDNYENERGDVKNNSDTNSPKDNSENDQDNVDNNSDINKIEYETIFKNRSFGQMIGNSYFVETKKVQITRRKKIYSIKSKVVYSSGYEDLIGLDILFKNRHEDEPVYSNGYEYIYDLNRFFNNDIPIQQNNDLPIINNENDDLKIDKIEGLENVDQNFLYTVSIKQFAKAQKFDKYISNSQKSFTSK